MSYEELVDFITNKMSMSHICQPVLIRTLIESGGLATLRKELQYDPRLTFLEEFLSEGHVGPRDRRNRRK